MNTAHKWMWGFMVTLIGLTINGARIEFSGHHAPLWYFVLTMIAFEGMILSFFAGVFIPSPTSEMAFDFENTRLEVMPLANVEEEHQTSMRATLFMRDLLERKHDLIDFNTVFKQDTYNAEIARSLQKAGLYDLLKIKKGD